MFCSPGPLGPPLPDQAVVLPLTVSGRANLLGAVVVGVNPFRRLDMDFRAFFTLISRQFPGDDTDLRAYLTRLLTGDGWAVHAAGDAETAVDTVLPLAGDPPDLVLTDVMLPGRGGLRLVTELRAAPRTARVPIMILTASGTDAAGEGLAAGADDYITKPFSSAELLARVRVNHELHGLREQAIGAAEDRADQVRDALTGNRVIGTAVGIFFAVLMTATNQALTHQIGRS